MARWFRHSIIIAFGLLAAIQVMAQQQPMYTQFMYNKLALNPAYAGYHDHLCITGIYRNQWMGFEGSPESQVLSVQAPVNQGRIGIGANLQYVTLGVSSLLTFDGIYSYRIPVGNGTLSLGAQASVRQMVVDYSDPRLKAVQNIALDPAIQSDRQSKVVANFGVGLYYNTDQFYAGLSAPRLMSSDIDFDDNTLFVAREEQHVYAMAGYVFRLNYSLDLVPQVLARYAVNSPMSWDFNTSVIWKENYTLGLTYRTGGTDADIGESLDVLFAAKIARGLLLGVSYDIGLSEIQRYSNGSLEVVLRYCFGQPAASTEFTNPRYF